MRVGALSAIFAAAAWFCGAGWAMAAEPGSPVSPRPNVLWITCEDTGCHLGCFGDEQAITPNLDRLAAEGIRYTHAFATAGVCAPARSTIITGVYPPALGTQHMRCSGSLPELVKCFPEYLQKAGYYCTNNNKEDYNFRTPKTAWNESSRKAHWRNRKPGQPFFAVFNLTVTHEGQIRASEKQYQKNTAQLNRRQLHDPANIAIPPYHPDTPEVRKDWARYYDNVTAMDEQVDGLLFDLEVDGPVESTIVFFYADHGPGMPRCKRWLYESSLHVPLIVRFPKAFAHLAPGAPGSATDRLVSFVDFAPTVLSLAGVKVPGHMQGKAFLGSQAAEPRKYVFGHRDRMDERYDMIRAVRDQRYLYLANFMSHVPWFHQQHISYLYEMPTMRVWQALSDRGKLTGPPAAFMARSKPVEELYDCQSDPHNVRNLAGSPEHAPILRRMRQAQQEWMREIVDLGLLPEPELQTRFQGKPPYQAVRERPDTYPLEHLLEAATLAGRRSAANVPRLVQLLSDSDSAARYWGATGLVALGPGARPALADLKKSLEDPSPSVRIAVAEAVARLGEVGVALPVLVAAMRDENEWVRLHAVNVLDRLGPQARPALETLTDARQERSEYVRRVAEYALEKLVKRPAPRSGS